MSAVCVENVIRKPEQLVEPEWLPLIDQLGNPCGLLRFALRGIVALRADLGVRQPGMCAVADVLVAKIAIEGFAFDVDQVIKRDGLRDGGAAIHREHEGERYNKNREGNQGKEWGSPCFAHTA